MSLKVKSYAPATIANLGSGFDVLGLAIDRPGDSVVAERRGEPGLSFSVRSKVGNIPTDVTKNVAAYVATIMLEEFRPEFGVNMTLLKNMPVGSGLGSSAASAVASVVAVNALLKKPHRKADLIRFCLEGERMASGAPHADNAAPCLLGGACLIRSYDPLDIIQIPAKDSVVWVVVHPHTVILTEDARNILPSAVSLKNAIRQWGNISGLTVGLAAGDAALIGTCVEDTIAEPVRGNLIPGFAEVKHAALKAGAYGCSISGSGPSIFAVASSDRSARKVGAAMKRAFRLSAGIPCDVFVSRINRKGAGIVSRETNR